MITAASFFEMALSFPGAEQTGHFDRVGFKVAGKRMFATYLAKNHTVNIFLTPEEQHVFCSIDDRHIYPVPNKWGEKGATTFHLNVVDRAVLMEALLSAHREIAGAK